MCARLGHVRGGGGGSCHGFEPRGVMGGGGRVEPRDTWGRMVSYDTRGAIQRERDHGAGDDAERA